MSHFYQRLSLLSGMLLIAVICIAQPVSRSNNKPAKTKAGARSAMAMPGVYQMTYQGVNMGNGDSVINRNQLKIYTDKYMLYVHPLPDDSLAGYGIGRYVVKDGKVIEYVFHTASGGAQRDTFALDINKRSDGFRMQVALPDGARQLLLTEDYNDVGKTGASPMDGAWKQVSAHYFPKSGDPITVSDPTQFKVFQSGHFAWVNTSLDSASQKPVSVFGWGTFEMNGANALTETNTRSTYATALVGKPVTVHIKFAGRNRYEQTIESEDGRQVELYERLK